ncbi:sialoglycan-binding domain-containing protein, partial [Fannyhessea vaginae]|uniref:sialoglycan-binding domain-containing protein n=1 Tax=Fannyhessea vaginae TaxID=82135 RepID=UPI0023F033B7
MKSQGKHTESTKRTKVQKNTHHADVSTFAAGATSMLVASSLYLGVNATQAEAHETTTDEHDSSHNLLLNSHKEAASNVTGSKSSPKHTPLHAEKSAPKAMGSSAPLEDSTHKKTLTSPLTQKKESASAASNTGVEPSVNNANTIEHAQDRSAQTTTTVRSKRSVASLRKAEDEDRDFDLKGLELHKVQGAKEFNSEEFKLQQAKNSAIAFLQYALSWNKDERNKVIDETAGNTEATDEAIGQNAILGIRKARDRDEIRRWLDYVFWHKRGMYIVPENPSDHRQTGDVFDYYKPGTFLYGTHNNPTEIPTVKEINGTVYVSNQPIRDKDGKLVGYRWRVRFNGNHGKHSSGHFYFSTPKGQTIVSSQNSDASRGITFQDSALIRTTEHNIGGKVTQKGATLDTVFDSAGVFLPPNRVTGTAEGPTKYYDAHHEKDGVNIWWGKSLIARWNYVGFAHTLKDIIYKHYWEGTSYPQSGCKPRTNGGQKEWVDEAEFTNGKDGIKMGPFVDNLYKYKFDFAQGQSSEYQRIDYAQLIQENSDRVFMFETHSSDTNTYEFTYDTRIDDFNSTNVHNPYYAAGYHSYENWTTCNYMQWGGIRFKPELGITINGTKNEIKVDPTTKNEYVVVHEGEKTNISLTSKNDKQGLYMWTSDYKSNSPISYQLGKTEENLFNADFKETPVDVDNNVQNPYVHHNARIDLSGVVIAKPNSEMNIAWAGSGFPCFWDKDITDIYGDKRAVDDGLNAFLPNREIKSLNVRVIPAAAYAKKTKIDVRFKGQKIVLSQAEKEKVKQTVIDANKDHYDVVQNDAKHPFVVNDDGSVSFWISFNAAKHKNDRPDMQYRKLTLKASDTLSYSTVEVVPQDGSAEFSLTDANGNVKPTLTIYNHEPYTVQAKVTDTTNKMCDFLTTSSNVPGLSSDHWDYQKTHRGMSVDSSHPYVLTLNGQGVDRNGNGTYTFKFESWDGNNIQTFSMPITVVVAPQAGRYRNKVNGRFVTVEVNDPHANLTPERFVDDRTKALLSQAPSGDPHKKGVTYSWGVASGSHATPSKPSIDKLTNKGNGSKPVYVRATFSDGSTIDFTGNLCVNDTKKPQLAFEKVTQAADGKEHVESLHANADGSYNVDVYADEKFTIRVKGSDNSNIVQDLRVQAATGSGFPSWVTSDEGTVQQTYIRDTNGARDTRGSKANPYVVTLTGTAPKHPSDPNAEQTFELTARAWDVKDQTQDGRLKIRVLPQNRKYNNLRAHEQTIEVNGKVPDVRSFIYSSNGKQALLPKNAKFSYLDSEGKACTGFDNQYRIDPQIKTIHITLSDGSTVDVENAKLRVQDTKLASVSVVAKTGVTITGTAVNVQTVGSSFNTSKAPKLTVYANEAFSFDVEVRDNSNHVTDARLGNVEGSYLSSNDAAYQQGHRYQDTSKTPYTISVKGLARQQGTRTFRVNTWDGADHAGYMEFVVEVLPQAQKYQNLTGAQQTVEVNDPAAHLTPRDFVSQTTLNTLKNVKGVSYEWAKAEGAPTGTAPSIGKVSTRNGRSYVPFDVRVVARFSDNSTTQIIGKLIVQDTKAAQVNFATTSGVDSQHKPLAGKVEIHQTTQPVEVVVYRNERFSIQARVSDNSGVVNDARLVVVGDLPGITTDSATYNKDHRAKVGTQDNPYILTISGMVDPHMKLTSTDQSGRTYKPYTLKIKTWDGVDNTQQTDVKFIIKEQAAQFDSANVAGRTQSISVNKPLAYKAEDFVSEATKKLLSGANGGVTSYTFKGGAPSTSDVNEDGMVVSVLAHFSDGSTKEIQGTLVVTDANAPVVTFVKHEVSGKTNAVDVDNEQRTITVYRNEDFSVDVRVVDDSGIVNDAKLSNKGNAVVSFPNATITTDHDTPGVHHGQNPYILNISGKFNANASTGTYTRTIVAKDGQGNTSTTQFKFIVKNQSERFTQDQLQGAVKEVEVNSAAPAPSDFVNEDTKRLLGSSLAQNPYAFTEGHAPAIDKVDTRGKNVSITVTFSDNSTATITGTLKVVDTKAPQLKIEKTPDVSGVSNLVESITPDKSNHTTRIVVYRNEHFSIQAKATDNSGVINDVQRQGADIPGVSDDRDSYQAANRGTKGTTQDPYVLTISGTAPASTILNDSDPTTKRKSGVFTRSICAWDGVDKTSAETVQIVVKEQAAQFDGNQNIQGATKEVEVNSTEQLHPEDFVSEVTKKLFEKANGSETYAFTLDDDHKVDKVTAGAGSTVSVTVKFSDGSTQVVLGHLKVKDSVKPVLSVVKTPDTAGENNKAASVTQNGNTVTVEVYRNEHFSIQAKASDNSCLIRDVVVSGGAISGVTNDHDAHHNEYTDKKGSETDPYVVTISGTVPASTPLSKHGQDGHAYDQFTRTITVTDSAGNASKYTLKLVIKEQASQFEDSALTGATQTVEVNSGAHLQAADFVSADTKNALQAAKVTATYTFNDQNDHKIDVITKDQLGKKVTIKATFGDGSSRLIEGRLVVNDVTKPVARVEAPSEIKPLSGAGEGSTVSGTIANNVELKQSSTDTNTYNLTVWKNEAFELHIKAHDNSHIVSDIAVQGEDIQGFSSDHEAYKQKLGTSTKGTEADPYVLTVCGAFGKNAQTGSYSRTFRVFDESGNFTDIVLHITLKDQSDKYRDKKVFSSNKVLAPTGFDWTQALADAGQSLIAEKFVKHTGTVPSDVTYKLVVGQGGEPGTQPGGGATVAQKPTVVVTFSDGSHIDVALDVQTVTDTPSAEAGAHAQAPAVATTITRKIVVKQDGSLITPQPPAQSACFVRYVIEKSGEGQASSYETGMWLHPNLDEDGKIDSYSSSATFEKYQAEPKSGYTIFENHNDRLEVKPNPDPHGAITIPQRANAAFRSALIERAVDEAQARIAQGVNEYDYLVKTGDASDFEAASSIPDAVIEYKKNVIDAQGDQAPEGYVRITFNAGPNATIDNKASKSFDVLKGAKFSDITVPTVVANQGYT